MRSILAIPGGGSSGLNRRGGRRAVARGVPPAARARLSPCGSGGRRSARRAWPSVRPGRPSPGRSACRARHGGLLGGFRSGGGLGGALGLAGFGLGLLLLALGASRSARAAASAACSSRRACAAGSFCLAFIFSSRAALASLAALRRSMKSVPVCFNVSLFRINGGRQRFAAVGSGRIIASGGMFRRGRPGPRRSPADRIRPRALPCRSQASFARGRSV